MGDDNDKAGEAGTEKNPLDRLRLDLGLKPKLEPPPHPLGAGRQRAADEGATSSDEEGPAPAEAAPTLEERLQTFEEFPAYTVPRGTRPDVVLDQVRGDGTTTGLGHLHGIPIAFVGRGDELKELVAAYKLAAGTREPQVATVTGPRGTGKTRLAVELLETLRVSQYPFVLAACIGEDETSEQSQDVLQRLVASRLRLPGLETSVGDRLAVLKERVSERFDDEDADWAHHVLSAFYELPAPASMLREVQALRTDRSALRLAMREVAERLIRHEATNCPVVLWFDDLSYDDADGLIEVCELLVRLDGLPVLTILSGEGAEVVPLERLSAAGVGIRELTVGPLEHAGAEELVRDIFRLVEGLPSQLVEMVTEKAQGVPLAIEQLVRLLIDHGVVTVGPERWEIHLGRLGETESLPSTVEELARVRLQALPEDRRHLLEIAAMIGTSFTLNDLVRILRLEPMDYDEVPWFSDARESWTRDALLDLIGRELLTLRDGNEETFEFRVPGEQRALLETAGADLRRTVHGCFALVLRERGADPARIAQHLEAAGLFKEAARCWMKVGDAAERAYFNHSALDSFTHALEFLGPEDGDEFIELLSSVGRVAVRTGQTGVAETAYRTMVQTTFAFEDLRRAVKGYRGLGSAYLASASYVRADTSFRRALDLAERQEKGHAIASSLDRLAMAVYEVGEPGACAEAIKLLDRALEIRRSIGNPKGTADTLDAIGIVCIGRGDLNRSLACFTESINARRAVDDWSGLAATLVWTAVTSSKLGRQDVAQRHVEEALEVAERTGELAARLHALNLLAEFSLRDPGRSAHEQAAEHLANAVVLIEQLTDRASQTMCLSTRARLRVQGADLEGAYQDARLAAAAAEEGDSKRQLGIALRTLAEIQAAMIRERVQPRPSLTQTRDCFLQSQTLLEEMGNWHELAASLRSYGEFLLERGKKTESKRCFTRAEALDPLTRTG